VSLPHLPPGGGLVWVDFHWRCQEIRCYHIAQFRTQFVDHNDSNESEKKTETVASLTFDRLLTKLLINKYRRGYVLYGVKGVNGLMADVYLPFTTFIFMDHEK
jgi:hypothetical protein